MADRTSDPEMPAPESPNADALRARLRAVADAEQSRREDPAGAVTSPVSPTMAATAAATATAATATAAPPAATTAASRVREPDDLWDAPRAQPEEPLSPFLIPVDPASLRPHERVAAEPVRAPVAPEPVRPSAPARPGERGELPAMRVVSAPPLAPVEPSPSLPTLEAHVAELLRLVRAGEIAAARMQQDAATQDATTEVVRTRWRLTKELIGVAASLPPRLVGVLANAIARDDLASAKAELIAFRVEQPTAARDADVVLRTRAKAIQRGVAGALYVEPVVPPAPAPTSLRPERSGANVAWIVVVIALAIVRVAVRTSSHSSYDYHYTPPSYAYPDYETQRAAAEALAQARADLEREQPVAVPVVDEHLDTEEPAALRKDAAPDELVDEVERSLYILRETSWLSAEAGEAVSSLWVTSPFYDQCTTARTAMATLEKQTRRVSVAIARRHLKAVRARIDRLCPAAKKSKRG